MLGLLRLWADIIRPYDPDLACTLEALEGQFAEGPEDEDKRLALGLLLDAREVARHSIDPGKASLILHYNACINQLEEELSPPVD